MIFSNKVQAAIAAKLSTAGQAENLEKLGPLGEFLVTFGATEWSNIRQKNGNPYIVIYNKDKQPFTLMFSNKVTAEHNKEPFTKADLLENPVYYSEATDANQKTQIYFTIGVEGSRLDDVENIDFQALGLEAKPATTRKRNGATA